MISADNVGHSPPRCPGTLSRRGFLRTGLAGWAGLGLTDLLRLQSQAKSGVNNKSIIAIWLWGGPSHMETFDLKPDSPMEYRGQFRPIPTNVPGIEICEHLPLLAQHADKFALIRSVHHDSPGHANSSHTMLTGHPGDLLEAPPYKAKYPDFWSVTNKVLGERNAGIPPYVALPRTRYNSPAYLGTRFDPLEVRADPNSNKFRVPNLYIAARKRERLSTRLGLLDEFDNFRRDLDSTGLADSLDEFGQKAARMLTSDAARRAFDIQQEAPHTRDRYGRNIIGQRVLLARRLIEAGVRIVTVDFHQVPGQEARSWDDHASAWHIFESMRIRLPVLDQVTSALLEDLHQRGLSDDVLVLVMGEMSHTPKLSNFNGQPGREHWGNSMSIFMAGGGMKMGQVIGSTTHKGDEPKDRPLTPNDVLATWYQHLGVPLDTHFHDHQGRPTPILPSGRPIGELG